MSFAQLAGFYHASYSQCESPRQNALAQTRRRARLRLTTIMLLHGILSACGRPMQPDRCRSHACPGELFVALAENSKSIRVGVLAGEPIRLEGLTMIFEEGPQPGRPNLVPVVGSLEELVANPSVDYLVVDLNSTSGGLAVLDEVRRARPALKQIVIGPKNEDELVLKAVVAGARAYLDSDAGPETVRQAIDIVVSGSIWAPRRLLSRLIDRLLGVPQSDAAVGGPLLTDREREVLKLILVAKSNREIARQLGIEERTVKAHVGRLMRKLGADNRIELSMRAIHRSLVEAPSERKA